MSPFQWAGLSPQLISTLLTKWMGLQEGGRPYGSNFLSLAHSPSNIFQTSTGCPTPKWRLVAKIVYLALCFVSCKMHCCIKSEYVVGDVDGLSKVSTCVFFLYENIFSLLSPSFHWSTLPSLTMLFSPHHLPSILLSPLFLIPFFPILWSTPLSSFIIYLQFYSPLFFSSHPLLSSSPLLPPLHTFLLFLSSLLSFSPLSSLICFDSEETTGDWGHLSSLSSSSTARGRNVSDYERMLVFMKEHKSLWRDMTVFR